MSTRQPKHRGSANRDWESLNRTFGDDGRMESECWYMALRELPNIEASATILEGHFGDLASAGRAFDSLDEDVAKRFADVRRYVIEAEDGR